MTNEKYNSKVKFSHHTRLGQHFLTRPEIAGWVADAIPLNKETVVLEIGPGHGILTRELLARAGKVIAIEKDLALVAELQVTFSAEIAEGRLILLEQDIRDFDPESVTRPGRTGVVPPSEMLETQNMRTGLQTPSGDGFDHYNLPPTTYHLVANIPYYLTGYIIRKFLTTQHQPTSMAVLIQKEVAERIVAKDGKESLLSLSVKAYGTPHIAHIVKAGAFSPPPKVDSAILTVDRISRKHFTNPAHEAHFFELLHHAFQSKRKSIGGTLRGMVSDAQFEACGTLKTARPEDVRLEKWLRLSSLN